VEFLSLRSGRTYISRVYRKKADPVSLWNDMIVFWQEAELLWDKKPLVLVENKSSGPALVDFHQAFSAIRGFIRVTDIPGNSKYAPGRRGQADPENRAAAMVHVFESGSVMLPQKWTPWKENYMNEMLSFPRGQYKDQVMATLIGLEWLYPKISAFSLPHLQVTRSGW